MNLPGAQRQISGYLVVPKRPRLPLVSSGGRSGKAVPEPGVFCVRDWSLNMGSRGGGGHVKFYPYEKGGHKKF